MVDAIDGRIDGLACHVSHDDSQLAASRRATVPGPGRRRPHDRIQDGGTMGEDDDIEGWKRVWSAIEARLLKIPMSKADLYRDSLVSPRTFANMRRYGTPIAADPQTCRDLPRRGMDGRQRRPTRQRRRSGGHRGPARPGDAGHVGRPVDTSSANPARRTNSASSTVAIGSTTSANDSAAAASTTARHPSRPRRRVPTETCSTASTSSKMACENCATASPSWNGRSATCNAPVDLARRSTSDRGR